jgi:RND family efflux transporter MFP subunit
MTWHCMEMDIMQKTTILMLWMVAGAALASPMAAPLACLVEPEKIAEIGVAGSGVIDNIAVERGDVVRQGQLLATLKADVERASVGVAAVRAQAAAELRASEAAQELADIKHARSRQLAAIGFVSQEAVEQADIEARLARNRVLQAREAQQVSQHELMLTHSQLAQRSVRSPFAGLVVERYRNEGERVEREPILRVAKIDPLRVEVIMPASEFGKIKPGALATVKTDLPGKESLSARVVLIDRFLDAASNTFRVRLSLPNPRHEIPAGLRCGADFAPASSPQPAERRQKSSGAPDKAGTAGAQPST